MKKVGIVSATALLVILLGSTPAFAFGHQGVSLTMTGGVLNPGSQTYTIRGGQLVQANILGNAFEGQSSLFSFSLSAILLGGTVSGYAYFNLVTVSPQSGRTEVSATVDIDGITALPFAFPEGGAIPGFFSGPATIQITSDGVKSTISTEVSIESAYLNPFGGPIVISTDSGSVLIVATYSQAEIQWTDVELGGVLSGTIGGTSASGNFVMLVNSSENLKSGYELDHGAIDFVGMSPPDYSATGTFFGISVIPRSPEYATSCSSLLSLPPGTCTETALQSTGTFFQTTAGGSSINGIYSTSWGLPAVTFTSTISASIH